MIRRQFRGDTSPPPLYQTRTPETASRVLPFLSTNPSQSCMTMAQPNPDTNPATSTAHAVATSTEEMDTGPDDPETTAAPEPNTTGPQQQSDAQPQASRQDDQQSQDQPPASAPPPQKPEPVTPGPRAARFIEMYHSALSRTLARVNYDNFATCFPTIAAYAPNALRNVQKQMVDYLEDRCIVSSFLRLITSIGR